MILRIQRLEGKQLDLDEVAHYELPHQDLCCLQIQLFLSLVLKELMSKCLETNAVVVKNACCTKEHYEQIVRSCMTIH